MEIREKTLPVLCPKGDDLDCKYVNNIKKSGWWIRSITGSRLVIFFN